ncbi:MAG TPA: SMP-30/gluconolactonase/LRE family protein [Polyangiales bacterium]|nr:SMP-30/gluconolactonase/LRE family protein [Polyangiales bacterium]
MLALFGACADELSTHGGVYALAADACPDGFARGTAARGGARQLARMTPSPEGVTVCPNGDVFVARDPSGEVWRVQLDAAAQHAEQELWAKLGDRRPAGITCDERGRLFVATFATQSGQKGSLAPVMITEKGADPVELPQPTAAAPIAGLNGIVAVPGIGVYASDTNNSNIVLVHESAEAIFDTKVVASDISLANGLAFDPSTNTLYANASGSWELLQFKVAADGALSERKNVNVPVLFFMDGVAVDEKGDLYVADWLGGSVVQVSTGRAVMRIANPASLAFRGGTLLATDYKLGDAQAEGGLYAIDLGVCGAL